MIRQIVKFLRYFYNEPKVVLKGIRNKLIQILFYLTFFGKQSSCSREMVERGKRYIKKNLMWGKIVRKVGEIYESCLI